jgi:hypothetical protein
MAIQTLEMLAIKGYSEVTKSLAGLQADKPVLILNLEQKQQNQCLSNLELNLEMPQVREIKDQFEAGAQGRVEYSTRKLPETYCFGHLVTIPAKDIIEGKIILEDQHYFYGFTASKTYAKAGTYVYVASISRKRTL